MTAIPPRHVFADHTRLAVTELHKEWDSLHYFHILSWDGQHVVIRSIAAITADNEPDDYPNMMIALAGKHRREHPDEPAYAYLLQIEGYGVTEPGPDATDDERRHFDADRYGRTFHQRADAVEQAIAICADIHGRIWQCQKRRDTGTISDAFYPPDLPPGGGFIRALRAVARAAGILDHGMPDPTGTYRKP